MPHICKCSQAHWTSTMSPDNGTPDPAPESLPPHPGRNPAAPSRASTVGRWQAGRWCRRIIKPPGRSWSESIRTDRSSRLVCHTVVFNCAQPISSGLWYVHYYALVLVQYLVTSVSNALIELIICSHQIYMPQTLIKVHILLAKYKPYYKLVQTDISHTKIWV